MQKTAGQEWIDRSGAPLRRYADWHHSGGPGNGDGEAEEAEDQAGGDAERHERAGVMSAESQPHTLCVGVFTSGRIRVRRGPGGSAILSNHHLTAGLGSNS